MSRGPQGGPSGHVDHRCGAHRGHLVGMAELEAVMQGQGAPFAMLGLPALVLLCGTLVHDYASGQAQAASRAAAAAAIAWPSLFLGLRTSDADLQERLAAGLTLVLSVRCFTASHTTHSPVVSVRPATVPCDRSRCCNGGLGVVWTAHGRGSDNDLAGRASPCLLAVLRCGLGLSRTNSGP